MLSKAREYFCFFLGNYFLILLELSTEARPAVGGLGAPAGLGANAGLTMLGDGLGGNTNGLSTPLNPALTGVESPLVLPPRQY